MLAKNPEWILITEQDRKEEESNESGRIGRRYAYRVDDVEAFIQIHTSGWHRFGVVVLKKNKGNKAAVDDFFNTDHGRFETATRWRFMEDMYDVINIASAIVEFTVPAEVFAKKPETWLGNTIWSMVNQHMYHSDPVDECNYRERRIYAVPYFLILWPIGMLLKCLFGAVAALVFLMLGLWWAFWGWRPKNIFAEMRDAFLWRKGDWDMRYHGCNRWRVWAHDEYSAKKSRWPMPYEICGGLAAFGFIYYVATNISTARLISSLIIAACCLILYFLGVWSGNKVREMARQKAEKRQQEEIARERAYQQWLRDNFSITGMPNSVDLKHLPKPLDQRARTVHFFRTSFWSAKMKVCKPYSRN